MVETDATKKKVPPFWIDLWDPQSLDFGAHPDADTHLRLKLIRDWKEAWDQKVLAEAKAKEITILTNKGVTPVKITLRNF